MVKSDDGLDWWLGRGWKDLREIKRDYAKRESVSVIGAKNWLKYLQAIDLNTLPPYKRKVINAFKADLVLMLIEEDGL